MTEFVDLEAEEAVVGSILIDPDCFLEVREILKPEDFYHLNPKEVYQAFFDLEEDKSPLDLITIKKYLKTVKTSYLTQLLNSTPTSLHVLEYAKSVKKQSENRKYVQIANKIVKKALADELNVLEIVNDLQSVETLKISDFYTSGEVMSQSYDATERAAGGDGYIKTGLASVDGIIGGLFKTDLIVIGAPSGCGKTGFLLTLGKNICRMGKRVNMFSVEMSSEQIGHRLIGQVSGLSPFDLRRGVVGDYEKYHSAIAEIETWSLSLNDWGGISIAEIANKCRKNPCDIVIVDYLQIVKPTSSKGLQRYEAVGEVSLGLKNLAKELNVPVITGAQLNDDGDPRESKNIKQDSDIWATLERNGVPQEDKDELAWLKVTKHRNGPVGEAMLGFVNKLAMFRNF